MTRSAELNKSTIFSSRIRITDRGAPRRVDLVGKHLRLVPIDADTYLVLEKIKILTSIVRDLLKRDVHLLGEALALSLRQTSAIRRGGFSSGQLPEPLEPFCHSRDGTRITQNRDPVTRLDRCPHDNGHGADLRVIQHERRFHASQNIAAAPC